LVHQQLAGGEVDLPAFEFDQAFFEGGELVEDVEEGVCDGFGGRLKFVDEAVALF
jgi:hypothetical protein